MLALLRNLSAAFGVCKDIEHDHFQLRILTFGTKDLGVWSIDFTRTDPTGGDRMQLEEGSKLILGVNICIYSSSINVTAAKMFHKFFSVSSQKRFLAC